MGTRVRKLTGQEQDKVIKWVSTKVPEGKCPMCGSTLWTVGPELAEIPVHVLEGRQRAFYTAVLVRCASCGVTFHFKANRIGIDTKPTDNATDEAHAVGA